MTQGHPKPTMDPITLERVVVIDYTNWKGVRGMRRILPIRWVFVHDNEYHPGNQWLLKAFDFERDDYRDFAMSGIHSWKGVKDNAD